MKKITQEVYYWLANRLAFHPHSWLTWAAWRTVLVVLEIDKHIRRRNYREALRFLPLLLPRFKRVFTDRKSA